MRLGLFLAGVLAAVATQASALDCPAGYRLGPNGQCQPAKASQVTKTIKTTAPEHHMHAAAHAAFGHAGSGSADHAPAVEGFSSDAAHSAFRAYLGASVGSALGGAPPPAPPAVPTPYTYGGSTYAQTAGGGAAAPPVQLTPARAYLKGADIPPPHIGAYGVVSLRALATSPDERNRLMMLCRSVQSYLPLQSTLPASVGPEQQMLTVWPVEDPTTPQALADSCDYAVDHYDLYAGGQAISDAQKQHHALTGRGPFLIGWSPSNTRGVADRLVLVVDMSDYDSQQSFDNALQFWKGEVVENPGLWRQGFQLSLFKYALADFLNRYGVDLSSAVKLGH